MAREESGTTFGPPDPEQQRALAAAWKRLGRFATAAALFTSPGLVIALHRANDWPWWLCILVALVAIAAFRGLIDIICFRFIRRPSLYGATEEMKLDDALFRRRRWYWLTRFKRLIMLVVAFFVLATFMMLFVQSFLGVDTGLFNSLKAFRDTVPPDQRGAYAVNMLFNFFMLGGFLFFNIFLFLGPLMIMGLMQMKSFEPGDADWGVKLDDIRGQKEPKAEVERVITLWSAGEEFRKAGGKPERGLLLIGAPGTGKTMLSKGIATSFNSPLMTMPGSGFAQTFIGVDVMIVMALIWRARRLARKWGGQCMIFIDEIDAVGRRRQGLGAGSFGMTTQMPSLDTLQGGDLVYETKAWRDRVFADRDPGPQARFQLPERLTKFMFPGMGGSMALNQLLVAMDGMDSPPVFRKWATKKFNTFLDALYVVPSKLGATRLRLKAPKPRGEQIYFIGATNIDINELDPALLRPGRMGRHIYFRTPNKEDREDIFDLYLGKVDHDPELDTPRRRDELARITGGYSPAMIEQVCSMALTTAHSDGRPYFEWADVIAAVTTIESGLALGIEYTEEDTRAVALHEAGHAVTSHLFEHKYEGTRLSIRMRGGSLGHYMAREKEERFTQWRHEYIGRLICILGAMATEHEFYGENGSGVGGDLGQATYAVATMVGLAGMGAEPIDLSHLEFESEEERDAMVRRLQLRFERIGQTLMNRASMGSMMTGDPIAAILGNPAKSRTAAIILGQAYVTARCTIRANREAVARVADTLVERKELHGDEVLELLDAANLKAPEIDISDDAIWPTEIDVRTIEEPKKAA
jgi:ATP-dependent Zn protease